MLDPVWQGSGHVGCRVSGDAICSFPHKVIITHPAEVAEEPHWNGQM